MATAIVNGGLMTWKSSADDEGYKEYVVEWLIESDDSMDGPETVRNTPGLPLVGELYIFGNDANIFAWRKPKDSVEPHQGKQGDNPFWKVTHYFSNKPPEKSKERCQDTAIEDPLLEPPKVTQGFNKFSQEATHDRFGRPIVNSAHEQIRGPQVEFDEGRATIGIEINVASVDRAIVDSMKNTLNRDTLWGFPRRCVKLSSYNVENRYKGTCQIYYTLKLEFETFVIVDRATGEVKSGWDRDLLDEGTKALRGRWDEDGTWQLIDINGELPDPGNPTHFDRFADRNGNPCRVVLNGAGLPALVTAGLGNYFISLIGGNTGNPVSDSDSWLPLSIELLDEIDNPWNWNPSQGYTQGQLVNYDSSTWVALVDIEASLLADTPDTSLDWLELPGGAVDEGLYNPATSYALGSVAEDTEDTSAGKIHVEKYNEADHLILGIPGVLP